MKFKELTKKNINELQRLLKSDREKLRDLRFKIANKQLKDVRKIRKVKDEIAQILTALNQKKLEVQEETEDQKEGSNK